MRHHKINVFTLIIVAVLSLGLAQTTLAKGKPAKVEVTAASPQDAFQGEMLPVTISGSGFDAGSQVSYLVSGTTDDTQVIVDDVEYVSPSELRTHIRVNGNATVSDYDIEVQNSSGRKGKGTTLFRVKQADTGCNSGDSTEPAIVYLSGWETMGDFNTQDLYLSNRSGCVQYLLLEDAAAYLSDTPQNQGVNRFISSVGDLRMDVRGDLGVVTWHDAYQSPWLQMGIIFTVDENGNVVPESGSPWQLYDSPEGHGIFDADVHISDTDDIELVMLERSETDPSVRIISVYNWTTDTYEVVSSGDCLVQDANGVCYKPYSSTVLWDPSGAAVYFTLEDRSSQSAYFGVVARAIRLTDGWSQPELITQPVNSMGLRSVSSTGLLAYRYWKVDYNKRGKITAQGYVSGILDAAECSYDPCLPGDGVLADQPDRFLDRWSADGAILFYDQSGGGGSIREYTDPFTLTLGPLKISDIDPDFDTVQ
jgi:hypothetical protein